MSIYYMNGTYLDASDATLPIHDLAILRGYGAFDFLRTYHRHPFRLMDNIKRLRNSTGIIGLDYPHSDDDIYAIVMETLQRNIAHDNCPDYTIRILITGGISPNNLTPGDTPRLIVMVQPLKPNPPEWYTQGGRVITVNIERPFTDAKSINYLPAIVALKQAAGQGAIEALYCTSQNYVLEGTTTNLFIFKKNTLITPPDGILAGRTRQAVLELAAAHYPVAQKHILLDELYHADEIFITASNRRIVPVIQVNDMQIAAGTPGTKSQHIMNLFDELTFGQVQTENAAIMR